MGYMTRNSEENVTFSNEEWRDIPRYLGRYQVSSYGRVRTFPKDVSYMNPNGTYSYQILGGEIMRQQKDAKGYCYITLSQENLSVSQELVHRLVAESFIPNPNFYPVVNHKDENPSNNHRDNLEWCTYQYNCTYGTALSRMSEKARERGRRIGMYSLSDGSLIKVFKCPAEISEYFNKDMHGNILAVCNGRRKKCAGYNWKFIGNE